LDSHRDWGHSKDYVRAMTLILNHNVPDDFVIATGETRTVRELLSIVFEILDLNYLDFVRQDPKYMRPEELPFLRGDSSKARTVLGWKPEISFEDLVQEMISDWFGRLSSN